MSDRKLELGQIVATPGALAALEDSGEEVGNCHGTPPGIGATSAMTTAEKMNTQWCTDFGCSRPTP